MFFDVENVFFNVENVFFNVENVFFNVENVFYRRCTPWYHWISSCPKVFKSI